MEQEENFLKKGMDHSVAGNLVFPIEPYTVSGYRFGQRVRSRVVLWARHLGDDILANPGMAVVAIGDGKVMWSEVRAGSRQRRNWGGIVVIGHIHKKTGQKFYSLYGHITNIAVTVGQEVRSGQAVGVIAPGSSTENGWWQKPHLHFGIYVGPWTDIVLPGYKRFFDDRTKFSWWRSPQAFIQDYNRV